MVEPVGMNRYIELGLADEMDRFDGNYFLCIKKKPKFITVRPDNLLNTRYTGLLYQAVSN